MQCGTLPISLRQSNVEISYNHLYAVEYLYGLVIFIALSIAMKDVWTSVVKWPNIRPQNEKGADRKVDWPDKFEVEFFLILYRKGQKEGKLLKSLFSSLVLSNSRKVQELLYFCYWYRPRTFFFQKHKCLWKGKISRGRIFSSAAEFFPRELTGKVCQELATMA